jgi:EmrB/QacA subfamily drug resistance transporter
MSIMAVPAMLAPILGPTLGGLIVQNASWRWIFYVNVPIGVMAVLAAIRILPSVKPEPTERLDILGFVLMALGLPLLTYGLAEIGTTGSFTAAKVVYPIILGVVLIAAFAWHALRVRNPLLQLRLYRRPTFSSASIAMFCLGAALFGAMILLPLYWQEIRHESVVDTGLLTSPQGLGMALIMPISGKLTDRFGGGPLALIGVLITGLATIPFGMIGAHTSIAYLFGAMFVRGIGIGFAFMPAMTAAFAALERDELSHATPQLNVLQRVGGSIGTAILAVVLQRSLRGVHSVVAVAIIPCVVLVITERNARRRRLAAVSVDREALAEAVAA